MRREKQPSIVLIMTDQQRYDMLGCNGNKVIQTPCLDRLAAEGIRFSQAYTPVPVCVAARCALMTGKYPHTTGIVDNQCDVHGRVEKHLLAILREAGFRTALCGKNHTFLKADNFDLCREYGHSHGPTDGSDLFEQYNGYLNQVTRLAMEPAPFPVEATFSHRISTDALTFVRDHN